MWAARFWHGMLLSVWLRLLFKNHLAINPLKYPLTFTVSCATVFNSLLRPIQNIIYGRRVAATVIKNEPIFIIGHWRSGTTLLHELLVLDERHAFPTTYECFAPNHFLISERFITKLRFLLPEQRPMDNMATSWDRPQEDEFALFNMGAPSPYLTMAFPNRPPQDSQYLTLEGLSKGEIERWKSILLNFLRLVSFRNPKRMVLKSPPHTARVDVLLEMFPDARFVHIVRDPCAVYASTMKLWKTFYDVQALQVAHLRGLDEYVLGTFEQMYTKFEADREKIDPSRFFEVRYEDLVRDPHEQMRALYEKLDLRNFDAVEPKLNEYLKNTKDYKTNKFQIDPAVRERVYQRWGPFMSKYGYCQESVTRG